MSIKQDQEYPFLEPKDVDKLMKQQKYFLMEKLTTI